VAGHALGGADGDLAGAFFAQGDLDGLVSPASLRGLLVPWALM
jgi:hypothetical protein